MSQAVQKERVRGSHLRVSVPNSQGVPFERALVLAEEANGVIASNKRLDTAVNSDEWRNINHVFLAWSGTMTAYVKPDQKLGKQVGYTDPNTGNRWVFPVPEVHQDKKNAILVAEHHHYTLEIDGNNRVVHAAKVDLVKSFPANDGWYLTDSKYGIPTGRHIYPKNLRRLWRIDTRVGPVARDICNHCRHFYLDYWPSDSYGVVVEANEID